MRKILLLSCVCAVIIRCTDKSSGTINPPPPPINELDAAISINGSSFISNTSIGANTVFASSNDASGNLIIDIKANFQQGHMALKLVNITSPGTYTINNGGTQYVVDTFSVGSGPNEIFTVPPPPPISGKVTVEAIDQFKIKGNFYMTCTGPGGSVELKSGTFDGKY